MSRPTMRNRDIAQAAATEFLALHGEDLGLPPWSGDAEDKLLAVLTEAMEDGCALDGYELAKLLEERGVVRSTAAMVSTLECFYFVGLTKEFAAVKDWVRQSQISAKLQVGDEVEVEHLGGTHRGVIAGVDAEQAKYTVCVASLGHVPKGQLGTQGFIMPFELFHSIVASPEDFELIG